MEENNCLIDRFGRIVDYLRISVTDRCNLRCIYCMPQDGVKFIPCDHILSYEEILALTDIFIEMGIKKIRITGGEPLLRKNVLFLLENLKKRGLIELVLTTNGVLLDRYASGLKQAGIKRINVSLDSLNSDTYRRITRTDSLFHVIKGIKKASSSGLRIKVNVVAMRGINDGELLDFVRFGMENELGLRFIEVMPQYYSKEMARKLFISSKTILDRIGKEYTLAHLQNPKNGSVERLYEINRMSFRFGIISAMSRPFCRKCNRLRLMADGVLKACLFGIEGSNLKRMLKENKTPEEIKRAIKAVVMEKPEGHFLDERETNLIMHRAGG